MELPVGLIRLLVALFAASLGRAEDLGDSDFWLRTADPGYGEYTRAMQEGLLQLEEARRVRLGSAVLEAAEAAFHRAVSASPERPEGWLALGETLADMPGREPEAISAYETARELDAVPDDAVAFELGILYSKLGQFDRATSEYDRLIGNEAPDHRRSVALANSAEAAMALGRLDDAIDRYRRAIDLAPGDADARLGAVWGLAIAFDRDEQIAMAQETGQQARRLDPAASYLSKSGVFFIPEGDIHYYRAFAEELAGRYGPAYSEWKRFLEAMPKSPWAYRARQHMEACRRSGIIGTGKATTRRRKQTP